MQGCKCSDPRFFRSVVPLKCFLCHQWSYLEPGCSCALCDRTYKRVAGHTGHFEDQHFDVAAEERKEQLKKMKKTGTLLKNLLNEINRLNGRLEDASAASDSAPFSKNMNGARKNLQKTSKHMDNAVANHNQAREKLEMRIAKRSLKWHNKFLRRVPGSTRTVCISCPYIGRGDYVAHVHSKQHILQAYPLLVAEQLLQSLGCFPQTIVDMIVE